MFAGFNLQLEEGDILGDYYYEAGLEVFNQHKTIVESNLEKFICENGNIDATKLQDNWFPEIPANVFLSHSHKDEPLIISFAGWLYELFGITSFIDSCVWGYADNLQEILDQKMCKPITNERGGMSYNYKLRNYSTGHVHMMLNMALAKMIDNCECLIFINTPSSITIKDSIEKPKTNSSWIYSELELSRLIRHKKLESYRRLEHKGTYEVSESVNLEYDVTKDLDELVPLNGQDLLWMWTYARKNICNYPLDKLYEYKGIISSPVLE